MKKICCTWRVGLWLLAAACLSMHAEARAHEPLLLRDPSVSRTQIAFSYAGCIWVAARDGSKLIRLTAGGHDAKPIFSPDGSQIAFTGEQYDGTRAVYVVSAKGGAPHQLTYHPADIAAVGWTPDGRRVLFSSARSAFVSWTARLFTVPATGGFATPVPLPRASAGSYSRDASSIAYVPNEEWEGPQGGAQDAWKHYRGGQTQRIWIARLSDSRIEARIPRDNSNDFDPMWVSDTVYFLSDRSGPVTLYSYDVNSHRVRQVVKNNGLDIKSAAATADAIVYEKFGSLHLLDLASGHDKTLDLRPIADLPEVRPHWVTIESEVLRSADLAPQGVYAVFGARGDIFIAPAAQGKVRDLTRTTHVVERDPASSPDGKSIAYFSDESGEYALHVRDIRPPQAVRKIDLGKPPSFYYSPTWSPDSRKIGYTDKRLNYWYVDLEKKVPVRIDTDLYVDPEFSLQLAWSPDSRWIAYTKQLPNHLHAVFLYSLERARSYQVTDGMSDAQYVAFDKSGEYLYFTASTDIGVKRDWLDMSSFQHPVTRSVYAILLRDDVPSPLAEESRKAGHRVANTEPGHSTITRTGIDLAEIAQRTIALPIPARNYYALLAGKPGSVFLVQGPSVDHLPFDFEVATKVLRFDIGTRRTTQVLNDVSCFHVSNGPNMPLFHLSFDGGTMLYASHGRWFIGSVDASSRESAASQRNSSLNLESMKVYVDPRAEWRHMYRQVWRDERDFLYDPGLHGLMLAAVRKKYERFLDNIATRHDLAYLFEEMLGNINVSHMSVGEGSKPPRVRTGLLGADYSLENGRYRFARVYGGDTWDPQLHAPLAQPGAVVQAGEYLLAVNGRDVRPPADVYGFFAGTAGKRVVLKVGPGPDGTGAREVEVTPVDDEIPLRYFAWIEANRREVDEMSHGRVAYVHMSNTSAEGYAQFNRYYFAQVGKQAIVIDDRFGHGGKVADYIINMLRRPVVGYWDMREGRDTTTPLTAIFGPKVMLINEMAGSGSDALPWMFRQAALGPLVGMRTWGGLVGIYSVPDDLLDGGSLATPDLAFYNPDGAWDVENHGVSPDVKVEEDPHAMRLGHDPQLERAVEVAMGLLRRNPPRPAASRPRFPVYNH